MKKIKSKKWVVIAALLSMGLLVAFVACAPAAPPAEEAVTEEVTTEEVEAPPPPEKVTLSIISEFTEGDPKEILDKIIAEFQAAYPNVTVISNPVPSEKLEDVVRTGIVGGAPPSWFFVDFPTDLKYLVDQGLIADLSPYYEKYGWYDIFPKNSYEVVTWDGKNYGVPFEGGPVSLFHYNKALFEELGLQPPQTWEEFLGVLEKIREAGVAPIGLGGKDRWPAGHIGSSLLITSLGVDKYLELVSGKMSWESPEVIEAFDRYKELVDKGYIVKGAAGLSRDEIRALFWSGKTAMELVGFWMPFFFGEMPEGFELDYFVFPKVNEEVPYALFLNKNGFAMSEAEQNKDVAAEFMNLFLSEKYQVEFAKIARFVLRDGALNENTVMTPLTLRYLEDEKKWGGIGGVDVVASPQVSDAFEDAMVGIIAGQLDGAAAAAQIEAARQRETEQ